MKSTTSWVAGAFGALALAWVCGSDIAAAAERPIDGVVPDSNFIPGKPDDCPQGQQQGGKRFCVSKEQQQERSYQEAVLACDSDGARVCTSQDLIELHIETELDAQYDPNGAWLGDLMVDGAAPCGIASIEGEDADFVGACDQSQPRAFWCCSDV